MSNERKPLLQVRDLKIAFGERRRKFYAVGGVSFDIFRGETFGLVALEGMAHGLPVVACDVGGLPELVEDGISGYLVPVGDVERLTDRVQRLLEDADLRKRMGAAGRERAARLFAPETHRRKMLEIYAGI